MKHHKQKSNAACRQKDECNTTIATTTLFAYTYTACS